jgi:hypothetical protein
MLIRLIWTIDHEYIVVIGMVIFVQNLLRVYKDLSILHFQLMKMYLEVKLDILVLGAKIKSF